MSPLQKLVSGSLMPRSCYEVTDALREGDCGDLEGRANEADSRYT